MSEISAAIKQLCEEKNLDYQAVIAAVEIALAAAYRKDYGERNQNIRVKFDPNSGKSEIFDVKTVVDNLPEQEEAEMLQNLYNPNPKDLHKEETRGDNFRNEASVEEELTEEGKKKFNPKTDIQLKEATILKHDAQIGEEIVTELPIPDSYGRMAAQTAKQVIIQKLREMERDMIFGEFKGKEKEVVAGIVQRREGRFVFVDLGKAIGLLPAEEQIYGERYNPNDRLKVFIKEVREGHKGPEIILSRRAEEILRKVFYLEIPEIANGLVEIKAVAREAGSRSKVAIWTDAENVDPVGSCVGQRGSRVQTIISELGGEKIDIIEYNEDPAKFIANSLAPAKIMDIDLNEAEHKASVKVASDKLSLAIGKSGQNVRLAARLTGWKIDIIEASAEGEKKVLDSEEAVAVLSAVEETPEQAAGETPELVVEGSIETVSTEEVEPTEVKKTRKKAVKEEASEEKPAKKVKKSKKE
ncbi:MAG: transcription termination factor NusA [Patescibacteria group bacterium]|jgi:N utilization substance protein A